MRYFTEKPKDPIRNRKYNYECNHPLYSTCTLFKIEDKGLAVVQQRFNAKLKVFWYGPIDTWLADKIFWDDGFELYFFKHAENCKDGLYPTVTVRQLMWALKMKPLKKEWWESQDKQFL